MKTYFKLLLALYGAGLAVGLFCRILLKQNYIDSATGFYSGGGVLVTVFNTVLAAVPLIMFISNRLKKTEGDYPVRTRGRALNALAVLTGIAIAAFAIAGAPESHLQQGYSQTFYEIRNYINLVLGVVSGLVFIYIGIAGALKSGETPLGGVTVIPAVWQTILLITRYNAYTTVVAISDHLLAVLFMIFASLFFMGQARTLSGQMRKDGRNYTIPSGFCASLCGFLLVIPNYVYVFSRPPSVPVSMVGFVKAYAMSMPTGLLGWFESFYVLLMSVYAAAFAVGLIRSIKRV